MPFKGRMEDKERKAENSLYIPVLAYFPMKIAPSAKQPSLWCCIQVIPMCLIMFRHYFSIHKHPQPFIHAYPILQEQPHDIRLLPRPPLTRSIIARSILAMAYFSSGTLTVIQLLQEINFQPRPHIIYGTADDLLFMLKVILGNVLGRKRFNRQDVVPFL